MRGQHFRDGPANSTETQDMHGQTSTNGTGRGKRATQVVATTPHGSVAGGALGSGVKGKGRASAALRRPSAVERKGMRYWAYCGVGASLGLSAVLNGLAFAEHASSPILAWGLGLAVPGLVLVFSRVSAGAWEGGRRGLAGCGAVATLALLLLSVQHLALSISRITGEHVGVAALMALAIDAGLVVCELFALRK